MTLFHNQFLTLGAVRATNFDALDCFLVIKACGFHNYAVVSVVASGTGCAKSSTGD